MNDAAPAPTDMNCERTSEVVSLCPSWRSEAAGEGTHLMLVQVDEREQLGAERDRVLVDVVERALEVAVGLGAQLALVRSRLGRVAVVLGLVLLRPDAVQEALQGGCRASVMRGEGEGDEREIGTHDGHGCVAVQLARGRRLVHALDGDVAQRLGERAQVGVVERIVCGREERVSASAASTRGEGAGRTGRVDRVDLVRVVGVGESRWVRRREGRADRVLGRRRLCTRCRRRERVPPGDLEVERLKEVVDAVQAVRQVGEGREGGEVERRKGVRAVWVAGRMEGGERRGVKGGQRCRGRARVERRRRPEGRRGEGGGRGRWCWQREVVWWWWADWGEAWRRRRIVRGGLGRRRGRGDGRREVGVAGSWRSAC